MTISAQDNLDTIEGDNIIGETKNNAEPASENYTFESMETVCNDLVPTIFIDGYWGTMISSGNVKLNLVEIKHNPNEQPSIKKHTVARLVIPVESFHKVVESLTVLSNNIKGSHKDTTE